jgi:hypothetical protein
MNTETYLAEFKAGVASFIEGGWPSYVVGGGGLPLHITHNRESLNQNEATYEDKFGGIYILTKLRSGHIVGAVEEESP